MILNMYIRSKLELFDLTMNDSLICLILRQLWWISVQSVVAYLHLSEAVVGHFVHEAVEQGGGASLVHSKLSLGREVVTFLQ